MIVVDTSAIVAIQAKEIDAEAMIAALWAGGIRLMSAVSHLEAGIVIMNRFGVAAADDLDALIAASRIEIVPFDREQAVCAREAFHRFGKGRHPAALNFADCAAYALAATRRAPLLYKGGDFGQTDIPPVLKV